MSDAGSALMGIGSSRGEDRAVAAAEMAISSPLLEASIDGAHGVLLSVAGGSDLGLFEINEAAQLVADAAHPEANIIFGAVIDDALGDEVRVTVIAAGFDGGRPSPIRPETVRRREAAAAEAASAAATTATARQPTRGGSHRSGAGPSGRTRADHLEAQRPGARSAAPSSSTTATTWTCPTSSSRWRLGR